MANIATHFMSLELHRKQNETKILLEKKASKKKKKENYRPLSHKQNDFKSEFFKNCQIIISYI